MWQLAARALPLLAKAPRFLLGAGKWALRAGKGLFNKPLTVGSTAAVAAGGTGLMALDNATGNKGSQFLVDNTPVAPLLEGALKFTSWANDQPAQVVQNLIENKLHERGTIDKDSAEYQGSDYQTLVESLTHFATGDAVGGTLKLGQVKDIELNEADIVESYRAVEEENPDATMADKCALVAQDMHDKILERRAAAQEAAQEDTHTAILSNDAPDVNKPVSERATTKETEQKVSQAFDLASFSKENLVDVFDKATSKMGFTGFLFKFVAGISRIFGKSAQNSFKQMMAPIVLSTLDRQEKYEVLKDSASRGNLVSANANAFKIPGIANKGLAYEPS